MRKVSVAIGILLALGMAAPGDAQAYDVIKVSNGGSISGKVTLKGKALEPKIIKVEKTPEVCGKEDRILTEVRADGSGNLADVVVYLRKVAKGKGYVDEELIKGPPPGARVAATGSGKKKLGVKVQPEKCVFGAFTGVVANGTLMRFDNKDSVKHSPHTYAVKGRVRKSMFNQDLEGNGKLDVPIKFKKKKQRSMKLECDQHNHMQNWFLRVDNPYYAFSGTDGSFKIDQVPAGSYELRAWHPKFRKELKQKVKVAAGGSASAKFQFKSRVK